MATKRSAIALVVTCTLFTSTAQIFYKIGADKLVFSFLSVVTNLPLLLGLFLYAIGAGILILGFRGGEVSVLYPIIATSYIWVSILSVIFLGESMGPIKWSGIFAISLGVVLVSTQGRKVEVSA